MSHDALWRTNMLMLHIERIMFCLCYISMDIRLSMAFIHNNWPQGVESIEWSVNQKIVLIERQESADNTFWLRWSTLGLGSNLIHFRQPGHVLKYSMDQHRHMRRFIRFLCDSTVCSEIPIWCTLNQFGSTTILRDRFKQQAPCATWIPIT